ncbi:unnamed protein product, partial [Iphiclides podalirius]
MRETAWLTVGKPEPELYRFAMVEIAIGRLVSSGGHGIGAARRSAASSTSGLGGNQSVSSETPLGNYSIKQKHPPAAFTSHRELCALF